MSIRVTDDKRECRVLVKNDTEISSVREILRKICLKEMLVEMPDDIVKTNQGYEIVFRNRHSLKEFLCFDGFGMEEYERLLGTIKKLFEFSEKEGINPYSFVFDISCIFTEDGKRFAFTYTPRCITGKNNSCTDLLSLVSLYSGFETDSPEEKTMRDFVEKVREWEEENVNGEIMRYDFPAKDFKENESEKAKKDIRIICLKRKRPFVSMFTKNGDEECICKIGRDREWADITTESVFSGRKHGEIISLDSKIFYRDLNTKNGSRINGMKLLPGEKYCLKKINKVEIGSDKKILLICI